MPLHNGWNRRGFLAAAAVVPALGLAGCASDTSASNEGVSRGTPPLPNVESDPTADAFAAQRIVPVLRDPSPDQAMATAQAWIAAGCSVIELTTSTPDVFPVVRQLADQGIYVGVGTIRSSEQVKQAAKSGAKFVLSFATFPELLEQAISSGITPIPGTMTPTEVFTSLEAPLIKVFPAATVGIDYLQALQIVYPGIRTQVTGGIGETPENSVEWLKAGATAVGVSGDVCGLVSELGAEAVTQKIRAYLDRVQLGTSTT